MKECIAIQKTKHGKWTYVAASLYQEDKLKNGKSVWKKVGILVESTSMNKTMKLAQEISNSKNIPIMPEVRHLNEIGIKTIDNSNSKCYS